MPMATTEPKPNGGVLAIEVSDALEAVSAKIRPQIVIEDLVTKCATLKRLSEMLGNPVLANVLQSISDDLVRASGGEK